MTEYDFIDPNLPKKREIRRTETKRINRRLKGDQRLEDYPELRKRALAITPPENSDYVDSDKVVVQDSSIVPKVKRTITAVFR